MIKKYILLLLFIILNVNISLCQEHKYAYVKPASTHDIFINMIKHNFINPAEDLYDLHWENSKVNPYKDNIIIPDKFEIHLEGFTMPTMSRKVTSNYGYRQKFGRNHNGLDIKVYTGDSIVSAFSGQVRVCGYESRGYGYYIIIRHYNGLETLYGHLSKILVKENQKIKSGELIGLGGNTGRSTGSHLHFETRFCGIAIDPSLLFDFPHQDIVNDKYLFKK